MEVLGDLGAFAREIKNIISQRRRERRGIIWWENTSHTLCTQRLCERKDYLISPGRKARKGVWGKNKIYIEVLCGPCASAREKTN